MPRRTSWGAADPRKGNRVGGEKLAEKDSLMHMPPPTPGDQRTTCRGRVASVLHPVAPVDQTSVAITLLATTPVQKSDHP